VSSGLYVHCLTCAKLSLVLADASDEAVECVNLKVLIIGFDLPIGHFA